MCVSAVVLAAGRGRRMGAEGNKVYLRLGEKTVLGHTLESLSACRRIDEIVLVVARSEHGEAREASGGLRVPVRYVNGGARRRDSAMAGILAAQGELVLIHDGARPFVDVSLIDRVIDAAGVHGAAVPTVPEVDSLRHASGDTLHPDVIDRQGLLKMQTPQGFSRDLLLQTLAEVEADLPDDAAAILAAGHPVRWVTGSPLNIKLTRPEDLALGEAILSLHRP